MEGSGGITLKKESLAPRRFDLVWIEEVFFALSMCGIVSHFWNLRLYLAVPLCAAFHLVQIVLWDRKKAILGALILLVVFCLEVVSVNIFHDYVATTFVFCAGALALSRSNRLAPVAVGLICFTILQGSGLIYSLENWWLTQGAVETFKLSKSPVPFSDFLGPVPLVLLCVTIWLSIEQKKSIKSFLAALVSFVVIPVAAAMSFESYWFMVAALAIVFAPPRKLTSNDQSPQNQARPSLSRFALVGCIAMLGFYVLQIGTAANPAPKHILFTKIGLGSIDPAPGPPTTDQMPLEATFRMLPVLLRSQGCGVETNSEISESNLRNTDFLFVINPTKEFTTAQAEIVMKRLNEGMTVLVAGDHTNMMEVGKGCNSLLRNTGIQLSYDSAIPNEYFPGWRHAIWQRSDIQKGTEAGNAFAISVGSSLQIDSSVRPLIVGVHGFSDKANFEAVPGHLGNMSLDPGERQESLILAADKRIGKGRLIVFGDTSSLQDGALTDSAQALWKLMRLSPTSLSVSPILFATGIILAMLLVSVAPLKRQIIGLGIVGFLTSMVVHFLDRDPVPLNIHDGAAFVADHAPVYPGVYSEEYLGKFFWLFMRKGIPCVSVPLNEAIRQKPKKIVLAGPRLALTSTESDELEAYVREGGDLYVFQDWKDRNATQEFLARQGLRLSDQPLGGKSYSSIASPTMLAKIPQNVASSLSDLVIDATSIEGDIEPIVKTYDKTTVGVKRVGLGRIIVSSDARWISDEVLGAQTQLNLKAARILYELI